MSKIIPYKICMKQIHHCQAHSLLTHFHGEDFQTLSKLKNQMIAVSSSMSYLTIASWRKEPLGLILALLHLWLVGER